MAAPPTNKVFASFPADHWPDDPIHTWLAELPRFPSEQPRQCCVENTMLGLTGLNGMKRRAWRIFEEYNEVQGRSADLERQGDSWLWWDELYQRLRRGATGPWNLSRRDLGEKKSRDNGEELD